MSDVSTSAARYLIRQPERLEGFAQRGRGTGGAGVQRQRGWGPRVVIVECQAQRREHEVARRDAVLLRSEEHTSELQSPCNLVCRLLLEKKKKHAVIAGAS